MTNKKILMTSIIVMTTILLTSPTLMGSSFAMAPMSNDEVSMQVLEDRTEIIRGNGYIAVIRPDVVDATDAASIVEASGGILDGVGLFTFTNAGGNFLCSGSLLDDGIHFLTAAHCVTDGSGVIDIVAGTGSVLFEGDLGDENIAVSNIFVHPAWTGSTRTHDLAVLELASQASADITRYSIDTNSGDDIGQIIQIVGYGASGTGLTGDIIPAGTKRAGDNQHDIGGNTYWQLFGLVAGVDFTSNAHLPYDFDNGLVANDGFDVFFSVPDLGEVNEVDQAGGDSGGPSFNAAGEVTGVHSFSASVRFADGSGSDIDAVDNNDTFGEFSSDARVSTGADFITPFIIQTGDIHVLKFTDLNDNGVQDGGDFGISGWEITLDCANGEGDTQDTDDDGLVWFEEILAPTECTVSEESQDGWVASTPTSVDFDLNQGDEIDVVFGNAPIADIHVLKFADLNNNGVQDGDDFGISGWEITLDCENGEGGTQDTDEDGLVWFEDILALTACTVTEETQDGWEASTPTSVDFELNPADEIDVVFGNAPFADIHVLKYHDLNANSVQDLPDEEGIPLWGIGFQCDNNESGNDLTNGDGLVWFEDILALTECTVTEEVRDGWIPTTDLEVTFDLNPADEIDVVFGNIHAIDAEKTWTHTDYNWDEICEEVTNPDGTISIVCRPANIETDDVLADPLETDNIGKYLAFAQVNKEKFRNTNPGAMYALTTIDVIADIDSLWVDEIYGECTDGGDGILKFVSKNPTRNVKVAVANSDGDVTELTDDLYDGVGGSIDANLDLAEVHITDADNLTAGSTVYVLVKFQDNLKNAQATDNVFDQMCHNEEVVTATIGQLPETSVTAEADLRITNQE